MDELDMLDEVESINSAGSLTRNFFAPTPEQFLQKINEYEEYFPKWIFHPATTNDEHGIGKNPFGLKWNEIEKTKKELFTDEKIKPFIKNLCLITGKLSDVTVVDVDNKGNTMEIWKKICEEIGGVPYTVTTKSQGGGFHFIFKHEPGLAATTGLIYKGEKVNIDIITNNQSNYYAPKY